MLSQVPVNICLEFLEENKGVCWGNHWNTEFGNDFNLFFTFLDHVKDQSLLVLLHTGALAVKLLLCLQNFNALNSLSDFFQLTFESTGDKFQLFWFEHWEIDKDLVYFIKVFLQSGLIKWGISLIYLLIVSFFVFIIVFIYMFPGCFIIDILLFFFNSCLSLLYLLLLNLFHFFFLFDRDWDVALS